MEEILEISFTCPECGIEGFATINLEDTEDPCVEKVDTYCCCGALNDKEDIIKQYKKYYE